MFEPYTLTINNFLVGIQNIHVQNETSETISQSQFQLYKGDCSTECDNLLIVPSGMSK